MIKLCIHQDTITITENVRGLIYRVVRSIRDLVLNGELELLQKFELDTDQLLVLLQKPLTRLITKNQFTVYSQLKDTGTLKLLFSSEVLFSDFVLQIPKDEFTVDLSDKPEDLDYHHALEYLLNELKKKHNEPNSFLLDRTKVKDDPLFQNSWLDFPYIPTSNTVKNIVDRKDRKDRQDRKDPQEDFVRSFIQTSTNQIHVPNGSWLHPNGEISYIKDFKQHNQNMDSVLRIEQRFPQLYFLKGTLFIPRLQDVLDKVLAFELFAQTQYHFLYRCPSILVHLQSPFFLMATGKSWRLQCFFELAQGQLGLHVVQRIQEGALVDTFNSSCDCAEDIMNKPDVFYYCFECVQDIDIPLIAT